MSKAAKTRTPPHHQAALEGRVRPAATDELQVELASRGRLTHHVVLRRQADPLELGQTPDVLVPQCLDCRQVESGYFDLYDCEQAVQVFRRLEKNRARTKERRALKAQGIDRLRAKHRQYDASRRIAKRQWLRYMRSVIEQLDMPEEVDPESSYWKPEGKPRPSGRPPVDPHDLVMCAAVYAGQAKTTLVDFHIMAEQLYRDGLLATKPAESWPSRALCQPWVRAKLEEAVCLAVRPVAHLVKTVATDKTGEEEQGAHTYRESVWGPRVPLKEVDTEAGWEKRAKAARSYTGLHLVVSTDLGLIVAAKARPGNESESRHLMDLLRHMRRFSAVAPDRLLADMGYSHPSLVQQVYDEFGYDLVTPPKQGSKPQVSGCSRWARNWRWYTMKYDEFVAVYGQRSIIEGVNSALKEAHGEALKSVHPEAKLTEAVGKAFAHTVTRVLQVMAERGLTSAVDQVLEVLEDEDALAYA